MTASLQRLSMKREERYLLARHMHGLKPRPYIDETCEALSQVATQINELNYCTTVLDQPVALVANIIPSCFISTKAEMATNRRDY